MYCPLENLFCLRFSSPNVSLDFVSGNIRNLGKFCSDILVGQCSTVICSPGLYLVRISIYATHLKPPFFFRFSTINFVQGKTKACNVM